MFEEALPPAQQQLCLTLSSVSAVSTFYLAGGTAAALHLGHRESIDLDFFRDAEFEADDVGRPLSTIGACRWDQYARNTLVGAVDGIKVSFFWYAYPLLESPAEFRGLRVASALDVACMKLVAIGQRGLRRDFVDLYWLVADLRMDLLTLWERTRDKFGLHGDSVYRLARGLAYFEDAEREAELRMRRPTAWADVRRFFAAESKHLLDRLV